MLPRLTLSKESFSTYIGSHNEYKMSFTSFYPPRRRQLAAHFSGNYWKKRDDFNVFNKTPYERTEKRQLRRVFQQSTLFQWQRQGEKLCSFLFHPEWQAGEWATELKMKSGVCVGNKTKNVIEVQRVPNERMRKLMHSIGRTITDARLICENKTHPDCHSVLGFKPSYM